MADDRGVARHYTHGALLETIRSGLETLGKTPGAATIDDLAPVDEFHIGGRRASEAFLGRLPLNSSSHVLDVGCGLGGAARLAADRFGCRVTGIDLTPEYVEVGKALCEWVGLSGRIDLRQGSALDLPFEDALFDAAYMLHVGMNIADKRAVFAEVARVLRPGATFGIYDVMRTGEGTLAFPVPWAEAPETSALAAPDDYRGALEAAGFAVTEARDRRDFALEFFAALAAKAAAAEGPPPLGLHLLMGPTAKRKVANMVENIEVGRIAPVELIARKT